MTQWDEALKDMEAMLTTVQVDMAHHRQQLSVLELKANKLSAAVDVIRGIVDGTEPTSPRFDSAPTDSEVASRLVRNEAMHGIFEPTRAPEKAIWQQDLDSLSRSPDLPQAESITRQPSKTSASYRAAVLLRDQNRPMTIPEIVSEFDQRGWNDPKWKGAKEAIGIAVRRTEQYGWTRRIDGNKYFYDPESHRPS